VVQVEAEDPEKVNGEHGEHALLPSDEKYPAVHVWQGPVDVGVNCPAGHAVQEKLDGTEYFPDAHG
jgi:hypothetical protein